MNHDFSRYGSINRCDRTNRKVKRQTRRKHNLRLHDESLSVDIVVLVSKFSIFSIASVNYRSFLSHSTKFFAFQMINLLYVCCFFLNFVSATINITTKQFLKDPETLVSDNAIYKIGFFSPSNSTNRYVGIWYNVEVSEELEVVWVANRDNPINDTSGVLKVSEDGNLQLLNGENMIFWSSNISQLANSSVAQLLDTGNLVLLSSASGRMIWQSFDHLTDSLIPQKLLIDKNIEENLLLRSWKSVSDPSSGRFTVRLIPGTLSECLTQYDDKPYWRSGPWNGEYFLGVPAKYVGVDNEFRFMNNDRDGTLDFSFSVANKSLLVHYVLNYDGSLIQKFWNKGSKKWGISWQSFMSECDYYGKCGLFGSCNPMHSPICSCLKGFEPKNIHEWSQGNWTSGCVRRTPLQCSENGGKVDGFLKLKNIKVPDYALWLFSNDQDDCRSKCLESCSCLAYAYPMGIGCMLWNGSLIDIQEFSAGGADVFIRLAHSELGKTANLSIIVPVIVITATTIVVVFVYFFWRRFYRRSGDKAANMETKLNHMMDPAIFKDLVLFKFKVLEVSTSNFSQTNKLGQGGFGPVYKGKMDDGQEIAVKRLSRASGQGLQEFMNEVLVISKLQHKNLVRLLGCCIEREEKLLVYEYLPNKSLDALLFDPLYRKELDWEKRFIIINGICRGLLYLHRDSRLKIIHRDLKASNILLDEEYNPKISDFGMARIFGTKQDKANTLRVVGTYGYMSPEYAMEGRFSEKSDVFSFGVLLLEIVSGRKNSSFQDSESWSILIYAWKLWNDNDMLSLADPAICDPRFKDEILKCIQLGLLCVQEFPEDRPTISEVISMLYVDNISDPRPKPPGFTQRQVYSTDRLIRDGHEHCSLSHFSLTDMSGR